MRKDETQGKKVFVVYKKEPPPVATVKAFRERFKAFHVETCKVDPTKRFSSSKSKNMVVVVGDNDDIEQFLRKASGKAVFMPASKTSVGHRQNDYDPEKRFQRQLRDSRADLAGSTEKRLALGTRGKPSTAVAPRSNRSNRGNTGSNDQGPSKGCDSTLPDGPERNAGRYAATRFVDQRPSREGVGRHRKSEIGTLRLTCNRSPISGGQFRLTHLKAKFIDTFPRD